MLFFDTCLETGTTTICLSEPTVVINKANGRQIKKLVSGERRFIINASSIEITIGEEMPSSEFAMILSPAVSIQYKGKNFTKVDCISFSGKQMQFSYSDEESKLGIDKKLQNSITDEKIAIDALEAELVRLKEMRMALQAEISQQEEENSALSESLRHAQEVYRLTDDQLIEAFSQARARYLKLYDEIQTTQKDAEKDQVTIIAMYENEFVDPQTLETIEREYALVRQQLDKLCEQLRNISLDAASSGDERTNELNKGR